MLNSERKSNYELMRIICMFFIIVDHLIGHGLSSNLDYSTINGVISLFFIPFGKIAFVCFIILSTWFLIDSTFKANRFLKVWLEVLFYNVVLGIVVFFTDSSPVADRNSIVLIIGSFFPIIGNTHGFFAAYLVFYLLLPILNIVSKNISKKYLVILITILILTQCIEPIFGYLINYTQPFQSEILLFILIFFITKLLKEYRPNLNEKRKTFLILFSAIYLIEFLIFFCYYNYWTSSILFTTLVRSISNEFSLLTIIAGYSLFYIFSSFKIPQSKIINIIASTVAGVLLIHDNNYFKDILWSKIINVENIVLLDAGSFLISILTISLLVFIVCSIIDLIRKKIVEQPIQKIKCYQYIESKIDSIYERGKNE